MTTLRELESELIQDCRDGYGTLYGQEDLADIVVALADECENRERNERTERRRSDEYQAAYRAAEAQCGDALSALRYIEQRYGRLDGVGWDRLQTLGPASTTDDCEAVVSEKKP